MRILLLAWGSRGDVQPFLALALGLRDAGHEVAIAAALDFREWIEGHGVGYEAFGANVGELSRTGLGREWLGGGARGLRHEMVLYGRVLRAVAEQVADTVVATLPDYDVFISGAVTFDALYGPARALGKRHVMAVLQPALAMTDGDSTMYAVRSRRRSPVNLLSSFVGALAYRPLVRPAGDLVRARLGLPAETWRSYVADGAATPALVAVSPLVAPHASSAPRSGRAAARVETTGFWFLEEPDWEPDARLAAFLVAGTPPVYVGFGSMTAQDSRGTMATVLAALARSGQRGVVLRGHADLDADLDADFGARSDAGSGVGLGTGLGRDDVLVIDGAPHRQLFPLMRAVVHHGGAGTTAAALHAGVPQVVVPHMGDQHYWGRRMHELGVAAAPLRRRDLTADRLADALRQATMRPDLATRAAELGFVVRAEDGVGNAVRALTRFFASPALGPTA